VREEIGVAAFQERGEKLMGKKPRCPRNRRHVHETLAKRQGLPRIGRTLDN